MKILENQTFSFHRKMSHQKMWRYFAVYRVCTLCAQLILILISSLSCCQIYKMMSKWLPISENFSLQKKRVFEMIRTDSKYHPIKLNFSFFVQANTKADICHPNKTNQTWLHFSITRCLSEFQQTRHWCCTSYIKNKTRRRTMDIKIKYNDFMHLE